MHRVLAVAVVMLPVLAASAASPTVELPPSAILIGPAAAKIPWPHPVLASPSEDGQFEIFVAREQLTGIVAPHCRSRWLLARMPATLPPIDAQSHLLPRDAANRSELARKLGEYGAIRDAVAAGRTVRLTLKDFADGARGKPQAVAFCNLTLEAP